MSGEPPLEAIAERLARDPAYRRELFALLERGQYREFRRYWAFDAEPWFRKHVDEVRRRGELLDVLGSYAAFRDARVLVVGAGFGAEAVALARRGARVAALDLDADLLAFSAMRAREHGVALVRLRGDGQRPPLRPESFDWVFLRQVLEHVPRARQAPLLAASGDLVRPGGHLFVDTPNRFDPIDRHDTGLPLVHWLPRRLRGALARRLRRDVPTFEPGAGGEQVGLHDFATLGEILRALPEFEPRSRYKEFSGVEAWAAHRATQGRTPGALRRFGLEIGTRWLGLARVAPIRLVLRKR